MVCWLSQLSSQLFLLCVMVMLRRLLFRVFMYVSYFSDFERPRVDSFFISFLSIYVNKILPFFEQRFCSPEMAFYASCVFNSFFRIWDKVVAGSSKILAFVAVSLLLVFRHQLLAEKTSEGVRIFLNKVWQHCMATCMATCAGEIASGWKNI